MPCSHPSGPPWRGSAACPPARVWEMPSWNAPGCSDARRSSPARLSNPGVGTLASCRPRGGMRCPDACVGLNRRHSGRPSLPSSGRRRAQCGPLRHDAAHRVLKCQGPVKVINVLGVCYQSVRLYHRRPSSLSYAQNRNLRKVKPTRHRARKLNHLAVIKHIQSVIIRNPAIPSVSYATPFCQRSV